MTISSAWADAYSYTFQTGDFSETGQTSQLNGVNWTLTFDNSSMVTTFDKKKGLHIGSNSCYTTAISLKTSEIYGVVTQIKVNTSGNSSVVATVVATVGGTAYGTPQAISADTATYIFEGNAAGEIELVWQQTSKKALYIRSVEVTYVMNQVRSIGELKALTAGDQATLVLSEAGMGLVQRVDTTDGVVNAYISTGTDTICFRDFLKADAGWHATAGGAIVGTVSGIVQGDDRGVYFTSLGDATAKNILCLDGVFTPVSTGFSHITKPQAANEDTWYDLQGRRLTAKPQSRGIYINKCGKKIIVTK